MDEQRQVEAVGKNQLVVFLPEGSTLPGDPPALEGSSRTCTFADCDTVSMRGLIVVLTRGRQVRHALTGGALYVELIEWLSEWRGSGGLTLLHVH